MNLNLLPAPHPDHNLNRTLTLTAAPDPQVVRLHTNNVLKSMLNANPEHVGFFQDRSENTALKMSLLLEKRKVSRRRQN